MWSGSRARVFIYPLACDMRKSFSGLCGLVRESLKSDPLSGHYFFFINKSKNYVKILTWDGTGYCLNMKKLPQGRFELPQSKELLLHELLSLIEKPLVNSGKKTNRYRHLPL
jgi:transposase